MNAVIGIVTMVRKTTRFAMSELLGMIYIIRNIDRSAMMAGIAILRMIKKIPRSLSSIAMLRKTIRPTMTEMIMGISMIVMFRMIVGNRGGQKDHVDLDVRNCRGNQIIGDVDRRNSWRSRCSE